MKKQEIADAVGVTQKTVDNKIKDLEKVEKFPNLLKLSINYQNFFWLAKGGDVVEKEGLQV